MTDKVVVTLKETETGFCMDFELPCNTAMAEVVPTLSSALSNAYPKQFGMKTVTGLSFQGTELTDTDTLASHAIWDGSELILKTRR